MSSSSSPRRYSNIEDSLMSSHDSMKSFDEEEPDWQQNLQSWKNRRHSLTLKERERKEEREVLELTPEKKPTRTFKDILKEKEKRISKQLSEEDNLVSSQWFKDDLEKEVLYEPDHHHDNTVVINQNNADHITTPTQSLSPENGANVVIQGSDTKTPPSVSVKPRMRIQMKKSSSYESPNSYSRVALGRVESFNDQEPNTPKEEKITYFYFFESEEAAEDGSAEQRIYVRRGSKVELEIQNMKQTEAKQGDIQKRTRKSSERLVMCVCDHPKEGEGFGFGISGGVDQGKPVIVKHVVSGGLLDLLNLEQDDEVLKVNEQCLNRMSHKSIVRILSAAVQSGGLTMKIKRHGQEVMTGDDTSSITMSSSMMKSLSHDDIPVRGLITSQVRKLASHFDSTLSPISDPQSEGEGGNSSLNTGLNDSGIVATDDEMMRGDPLSPQDIP